MTRPTIRQRSVGDARTKRGLSRQRLATALGTNSMSVKSRE